MSNSLLTTPDEKRVRNPASKEAVWLSQTRGNLDASYHSVDPSEHFGFSRPLMDGIDRFDGRSDAALTEALNDHPDAQERERAFWELMDRRPEDGAKVAENFLLREPEPCVRWGALWAAQKFLGQHFTDLALLGLKDKHIEVRDWARVLLSEVTGQDVPLAEGPRQAHRVENTPFDQTLPLVIAGYARVALPGGRFVQATLSPLWFESILGQVMACTSDETFEKDLVIEKCIEAYHPDGSDHFEIYKFSGFTQRVTDRICYHHYESQARHTFYPSGKVEDLSVEPLDDVNVILNRVAATRRLPLKLDKVRQVVETVRGRYTGYAFTSLERTIANGMVINPGEVQLSNLNHPVAGPLTNTLLFGSFRGKLSDHDGDGMLDVNTIRCHGTSAGALDYFGLGVPNPDPFDPLHLT